MKTVSDGADVTFCDRVFHSRDSSAATRKAKKVKGGRVGRQATMMRQSGDAPTGLDIRPLLGKFVIEADGAVRWPSADPDSQSFFEWKFMKKS